MDKITISKYGGDDLLSWAVFVGNRPVVTGLSRAEARFHKGVVERLATDQAARASRKVGPCTCACNSGGFCGGCGHAGCGSRKW